MDTMQIETPVKDPFGRLELKKEELRNMYLNNILAIIMYLKNQINKNIADIEGYHLYFNILTELKIDTSLILDLFKEVDIRDLEDYYKKRQMYHEIKLGGDFEMNRKIEGKLLGTILSYAKKVKEIVSSQME